jgi:hypothetical protein
MTSAVFNLPGDRENIVSIKADHMGMCKFDGKSQVDLDNFKIVWNNIEDLYDEAIRRGESNPLQQPLNQQEASLESRLAQLRPPQPLPNAFQASRGQASQP